ncbi:MAG: hypothetical protein RLZZ84_485 [Pseudomonadota bacterium]
MILNTVMTQALSAMTGRPIHHADHRAFSTLRGKTGQRATLSREEFRQAVLEVLG